MYKRQVKGKGKLSGTRSVTFKINAKPIKNAVITYNNSLTYNGSALSPAVTVKYGKPIAPEDIQLEKELDPHKLKAVKVKIMGEIKELVEGSNGGN